MNYVENTVGNGAFVHNNHMLHYIHYFLLQINMTNFNFANIPFLFNIIFPCMYVKNNSFLFCSDRIFSKCICVLQGNNNYTQTITYMKSL